MVPVAQLSSNRWQKQHPSPARKPKRKSGACARARFYIYHLYCGTNLTFSVEITLFKSTGQAFSSPPPPISLQNSSIHLLLQEIIIACGTDTVNSSRHGKILEGLSIIAGSKIPRN